MTPNFDTHASGHNPPRPVKGCDECNRTEAKSWPIFTVDYNGVEVCAKCLTPMRVPRVSAGDNQ